LQAVWLSSSQKSFGTSMVRLALQAAAIRATFNGNNFIVDTSFPVVATELCYI
jgi:hypothetical protein